MSGIAGIFNVPGTPEELLLWATTHATHHRDINRAIYNRTGIVLDEFVLDPIDPDNTTVWEDQHQVMHSQMDSVLGIGGYDLSEVNFKDPTLLNGWIQLNSNEHYIAANILEIG